MQWRSQATMGRIRNIMSLEHRWQYAGSLLVCRQWPFSSGRNILRAAVSVIGIGADLKSTVRITNLVFRHANLEKRSQRYLFPDLLTVLKPPIFDW